MPAVGVTDTANLFGALEFSEKAAEKGIQPIIGCKLPVRFEVVPDQDARRPGLDRSARHSAPLFLLAATESGYRGLMRLVTGYYLGGSGGGGPIPLEDLAAISGGLIALTGGHDGPLYPALAAADHSLAEARLLDLKRIFGDRLYVAVERHGMEVERQAEAAVVDLAYRPRSAACRDQRAVLPGRRRLRGA